MWEWTFFKRGNVTSFVEQTKKGSVISTMGRRENIFYKIIIICIFYMFYIWIVSTPRILFSGSVISNNEQRLLFTDIPK